MMMSLAGNDWSLKPLDTPAHAFGAFEKVVSQWREKKGSAVVPRWIDYAIRDFAGWHGRFSLCRVTAEDLPDLHFELFGTTIAEWVGRDLSGKTLLGSRLALPEEARIRFVEHFAAVAGRPAIGVRRVRLGFLDRGHVMGETVELPIGKTTRQPTHILSFARRLPG